MSNNTDKWIADYYYGHEGVGATIDQTAAYFGISPSEVHSSLARSYAETVAKSQDRNAKELAQTAS